jgi:hypothetical protein
MEMLIYLRASLKVMYKSFQQKSNVVNTCMKGGGRKGLYAPNAAINKRRISALSLKEKIGAAYQTAWTMCQKIRHAMGKRDEEYKVGE